MLIVELVALHPVVDQVLLVLAQKLLSLLSFTIMVVTTLTTAVFLDFRRLDRLFHLIN
jgi:hypothetical protein